MNVSVVAVALGREIVHVHVSVPPAAMFSDGQLTVAAWPPLVTALSDWSDAATGAVFATVTSPDAAHALSVAVDPSVTVYPTFALVPVASVSDE